MASTNKTLELLYFQVTDLWRLFCERHADLYDLTCEEYDCLLQSDIDSIEEIAARKEIIVNSVNDLDKMRNDLIGKVNLSLANMEGKKFTLINSVAELLKLMSTLEVEKNGRHLFSFNSLLIEIIEKIQEQNKKNQIFISKALHSLKTIRLEAMGEKNYSTYTSMGKQSQLRR